MRRVLIRARKVRFAPTCWRRDVVCCRATYVRVVDEIDERILAILRRNGRTSLRDIADAVALSPAPVKRRIDRLEEAGIIAGYTVVVDYGRAPGRFEAFTELRLPPGSDVEVVTAMLKQKPEVEQVFTIAGDPDALIRLRVESVQHLQDVVNDLRRAGQAMTTKTMIVMDAWQRL